MKDVIPEKSSFPLLVWDCDPGCDDALGIALFLKRQLASPSYDNVYFLTVAGNVSIEQTTFNAARVLIACLWQKEQSEQDTKKLAQQFMIYRGCNRSMDGEEPSAASVHGRDGLGDAPNSLIWEGKECDSGERPAEEIAKDLIGSLIQKNCSAVEKYLELSRQNGKKFDLLCTGPLTNVATALLLMSVEQQRSFWQNCRTIVVMGGAFNSSGNITHSSEFNTFADPIATQVVLDSFNDWIKSSEEKVTKKIHFVSLDTTETVALPLYGKQNLANTEVISPAANFILYALRQYGLFHVFHCTRPDRLIHHNYLKEFSFDGYVKSQLMGGSGDSELKRYCYLHDPLAAWLLLNPCLLTEDYWIENYIRIDTSRGEGRGRIIICDEKKKTPTPIPIYGTQVKWFSPVAFAENIRFAFVNEIADLLGIDTSKR